MNELSRRASFLYALLIIFFFFLIDEDKQVDMVYLDVREVFKKIPGGRLMNKAENMELGIKIT